MKSNVTRRDFRPKRHDWCRSCASRKPDLEMSLSTCTRCFVRGLKLAKPWDGVRRIYAD